VETIDGLIEGLRDACAGLPDRRHGKNGQYTMADIGMAAFAVFFMQSPSFLAHQRHLAQGSGHGRSNCETLFGMTKIPSDNHIRAMLDGVRPECFYPLFVKAFDALERDGGLAQFRRLGDHVLIAFDGTEYFRSAKLHCRCCSTRKRGTGKIEYFHAMVAATLVAPGHNRVVPLAPEFIVPQDGHDKQDCESVAARRWLAAHGADYARLNPIYLGDDLYSRQPICQAVLAAGGHFLFVCKPSSHPTIEEYLTGVELPALTQRVKRGRQRFTYTYRWLADVPLRDGADAITVNWLMIEIRNAAGAVTYRNSFITDLPVGRDTVVELAACGRARWKIENESFNTLKTKGYNLEHNFGHGQSHLAAVLATLNLLAFAFHTTAELLDDLWRNALHNIGARVHFFSHLRAITAYILFPSWTHLLHTLAGTIPQLRPP
jgi:hypothetical protein